MKLLFLSDIHEDNNYTWLHYSLVTPFLQYLRDVKPDYAIISGDIAGCSDQVVSFLNQLCEYRNKILFVPGNHDTWTFKESSWYEYNQLKEQPGCLCSGVKILGNYVVIGDMGWYDYSFRHRSVTEFDCEYLKKTLWHDADYNKWEMSDVELCNLMLKKLEDQIQQHQDKKIILVTHFVPWKDFLTLVDQDNIEVTDGYMGSSRMGELIDKYDNIKYIAFGHTHKRFGKVEFGNKTIICNPLGYTGGWKYVYAQDEFEHVGIIIDI